MKNHPFLSLLLLSTFCLPLHQLSADPKKSDAAESPRSPQESEGKWETWFQNDSMEGFRVVGGTATYEVKDGILTGTTAEGSPNTFLFSKPYRNFELQFEVNVDSQLNSGVQVRSKFHAKGEPAPEGMPIGRLYGPQVEIATNGTAGNFYDEGRHGKWWSELTQTEDVRTPEAKAAFKKDEWNHYRVVVIGDHYRSWVNGVLTADFKQDKDPEGGIGFQVHGIQKGTGPFSVRWRKVRFKELP